MDTKRNNQQARLTKLLAKEARNAAEDQEITKLQTKLASLIRGPPPQKNRPQNRVYKPGTSSGALVSTIARSGRRDYRAALAGGRRGLGLDYSLLGNTEAGRDYARIALNPGHGEWAFTGMPDNQSQAINTFRRKLDIKIAYDPTLWTTPPPEGQLWDAYMMFPPIGEIAVIYVLIVPNGGASKWVQIRYPSNDIAGQSKDIKSSKATMRDNGYADFRVTAMSETIELDANATSDQGRILVGQLAPAFEVRQLTPAQEPGSPAFLEVGESLNMTFVSTNSQISQLCADPYEGQARDGAYIIHKFTNPVDAYLYHETSTSGENRSVLGASATSFPGRWLSVSEYSDAWVTNNTWAEGSHYKHEVSTDTFPSNFNQSETAYGFACSDPCDMTTAHVRMSDLSPSAAIRIKSRKFLEAHAGFLSPVNEYSHPPVDCDKYALEAVAYVMKHQPEAYPAGANSFGTVMKSIFGFLGKWVNPVVKAAGYLPIPGAKLVSDLVSSGIETGDVLLNTSANLV